MTTYQMFKVINERLVTILEHQAHEFEHLSTALGDIMRDLDHIKSRVAVRKAGKVRRRAVGQSSQK